MSITAKYPGKCTKCLRPILVGQKIEWVKGAGSHHTDCGGSKSAPAAVSGKCACGKAIDAKYTQCYGCANPGAAKKSSRAGKWTGCACGSREDAYGQLIRSPRNCFSCIHDAD